MDEIPWDARDVAQELELSIYQARRALRRWQDAGQLSLAGRDSITGAHRYRPADVRAGPSLMPLMCHWNDIRVPFPITAKCALAKAATMVLSSIRGPAATPHTAGTDRPTQQMDD